MSSTASSPGADSGVIVSWATCEVGGGFKVDDIGSGDLPKLSDVESAIARLSDYNVRPFADGFFHAHLDSTSVAKMFLDDDLKRLNQSLPDYYMYKTMALGTMLNTIFVKNSECPRADTVSSDENLAMELKTPAGVDVRRILFMGQGLVKEYFNDQSSMITDAGMIGNGSAPSRRPSPSVSGRGSACPPALESAESTRPS